MEDVGGSSICGLAKMEHAVKQMKELPKACRPTQAYLEAYARLSTLDHPMEKVDSKESGCRDDDMQDDSVSDDNGQVSARSDREQASTSVCKYRFQMVDFAQCLPHYTALIIYICRNR
jgi:hypothetical protein